jgi:hypothetical protein
MFFLCKRSSLWIAAVLLGAAATAGAQEFQPLGPIGLGDLSDFQLFAPADLSNYGSFHPNTGPFFQYERLYWSVHQPSYALIGTPVNPSLSDNDNQFIGGNFDWGNRFELGYVQDDGYGWLLSILKTNNQQAKPLNEGQTRVGFINATGTPVSVLFSDNETMTNVTRLTGVELMKTYRYEPDDDLWGAWEVYFGARFLQVHDRFDFSQLEAVSPTSGQDQIDLGIDNNIVGPQIGGRWSNKRDRWTFDTQLRFMAGANFENASEYGSLVNTNTFPPMTTFNHTDHSVEFAPVGELRVNAIFQVSKAISLKVGYTALAMTGIGRASRRIDYVEPDLGIINGAKNDHLFANGVTFGFEVNR